MKTRVKVLLAAVFCGGMIFGAVGQIQVNQYGDIEFRSHANPYGNTYHYGDLQVSGGIGGNNYGWMVANRLYLNGNLNVYGSKNFIHPHPTDESKVIKYVAVESGEAVTLARGIAKTVNGEATVTLPEHFSLVTSKEALITVILTPEGVPVLLYTKQKSKDKIVVAMKKSEFETFSDVVFAFQVTGVRDGFEKQEVIISEDQLYSQTDKSGWENTEVGKKIKAHTERANVKLMEKYNEKK
jgi:hypothetical protein